MNNEINKERGSAWWILLGLGVPIAGIVLFFVFKNRQPKSSKFSLIGALISIGIHILITIISIVLLVMGVSFTVKKVDQVVKSPEFQDVLEEAKDKIKDEIERIEEENIYIEEYE